MDAIIMLDFLRVYDGPAAPAPLLGRVERAAWTLLSRDGVGVGDWSPTFPPFPILRPRREKKRQKGEANPRRPSSPRGP